MENQMILLNEHDVISTSSSHLMFQCTFKVIEFMTIIKEKLEEEENLFIQGIDCEVLSPGKTWQRGKIRLRLEFFPEDPNLNQNRNNQISDSNYGEISNENNPDINLQERYDNFEQ